MRSKTGSPASLLALVAAATAWGCTDPTSQPVNTPAAQFTKVAATVVAVADVDQLYATVNDPANEGAAITLAPGTYVLSANDASGVARPNGGRLELQRDMSLRGARHDRSAVVIDGTGLPASSLNDPVAGRTGVVRIGRGSNAVEWLTVLGNPAAAAGIETDLAGTASTRIRVAHVVSGGSSRGVDIRNAGAANAGRRIDAEIVDNEFFGPTQVQGMSQGIRVVNFVGADGGYIVTTLRRNRAHGFQVGCLVANFGSSNAVVEIRSSGDHFFANALGCQIAGGLSQPASGVANSNSTTFEAHGSKFVDNTAPIAGLDPGGIRVFGARATTQPNVASGNTVSVALWGSKVSGNLGVNFEAFGALEEALSGTAGTNNRVTIELHGISKKLDVVTTASLPVDPTGTNTVTVIRCRRTSPHGCST